MCKETKPIIFIKKFCLSWVGSNHNSSSILSGYLVIKLKSQWGNRLVFDGETNKACSIEHLVQAHAQCSYACSWLAFLGANLHSFSNNKENLEQIEVCNFIFLLFGTLINCAIALSKFQDCFETSLIPIWLYEQLRSKYSIKVYHNHKKSICQLNFRSKFSCIKTLKVVWMNMFNLKLLQYCFIVLTPELEDKFFSKEG